MRAWTFLNVALVATVVRAGSLETTTLQIQELLRVTEACSLTGSITSFVASTNVISGTISIFGSNLVFVGNDPQPSVYICNGVRYDIGSRTVPDSAVVVRDPQNGPQIDFVSELSSLWKETILPDIRLLSDVGTGLRLETNGFTLELKVDETGRIESYFTKSNYDSEQIEFDWSDSVFPREIRRLVIQGGIAFRTHLRVSQFREIRELSCSLPTNLGRRLAFDERKGRGTVFRIFDEIPSIDILNSLEDVELLNQYNQAIESLSLNESL